MNSDNKTNEEFREHLKVVSMAMARIHKMLLESEIEKHEKQHGITMNPAARLQALLTAPEFAWLRALSQLMAAIDEVYFQKEPIREEQMQTLKKDVEALLLQTAESEFSTKYRSLVGTVPGLIIEHGNLRLAVKQLASHLQGH